MVEEFRLPADFIVRQLVRRVGLGNDELRYQARGEGMVRAAVLIEAARAKALRERVVHHGVRCDMAGEVRTALEAGLGVLEIRCVEVVRVKWIVAATGWHAAFEAAETGEHAARRGVVEAEMTRAGGDRQHLRNQVEVDGGKEGRLLGFTHGVLIEGGGGGMNAWVHHGRPGKRAHVREAAGIAITRRPRRGVRSTRRNVLVTPAGLVQQLIVFPKRAGDRAETPLVRRAQAQFVLLVRVAFDRVPGGARREAG